MEVGSHLVLASSPRDFQKMACFLKILKDSFQTAVS